MAHLSSQRPSFVPSHARAASWRAGLLGVVAGLASACVISVGGDGWNNDPDVCFDIDTPEDLEIALDPGARWARVDEKVEAKKKPRLR